MYRKFAIMMLLILLIMNACSAQGFGHRQGHSVSRLESFHGYYAHARASHLASLRQRVNAAVQTNRPPMALNPLNEIIRIEPHDFYAWEFLSYTYAVLGDANSAANVDLDLVTYFEFIPQAAPQVSRAMQRLQIWDPYGWQGRVAAKRNGLIPYIPFEVMDNFIESVRPEMPQERRRQAQFEVERTMASRGECTEFIEIWRSGRMHGDQAMHKLENSRASKNAYHAIRDY